MSSASPPLSLKLGNTEIDRQATYNYLGITLDEHMTLEQHITGVINKVSSKLFQLRRLRCFLTEKGDLSIYKNMILPMLEYGDVFLSSATSSARKKLQILQNKALRCALNKEPRFSTQELHKLANLQKLKHRRKQHLLLHMYQLSQLPGFKGWKSKSKSSIRTRSSYKKLMITKKPNTIKFKRSITYQGPKAWNSLPESIQKLPSYHDFKKELSRLLKLNTEPNVKIPKQQKPKVRNRKK